MVNITVDDFFNKYNGIGLNWDGRYGNQCVDLAQFYNHEVVGAPPLTTSITGGAIDIWTTYPKDFYTAIPNNAIDPNSYPIKGDIVIFSIGKYGHISVCKSADFWTLTSFDQNWPIEGYIDGNGDFIGTGKCHFQAHSYLRDKVVGWLRPKVDPAQDKYNKILAIINDHTLSISMKIIKIQAIVAT